MSEFTRNSIKKLEQDIQKALKAVEKKQVRCGHDYSYAIKAIKASPYRETYLNRATEFGLDQDWLDKWFSSQISRTGWGGFVVVASTRRTANHRM
jgi:hypothetical protein